MKSCSCTTRHVILFIVLISLVLTSYVFPQTLKIMPIGDSITHGRGDDDNFGFRDDLENLLQSAGVAFDYVGHDSTAPYEGWFKNGAKIEDFLQGHSLDVGPALDLYQPDILLIHLGTNNASQTPGPYSHDGGATFNTLTSSGQLAQLLKYISQWNLQRIILCKIIPKKDGDQLYYNIKQFNAQIDQMFFDGLEKNKNSINWNIVTLSDMYHSINPNTDLNADGIHPTAEGYAKMAQEYDRILEGLWNAPDATAPAQIVLNGNYKNPLSAYLYWDAVGDDGNNGRANLYELRYSESPMNSLADFENAHLVSIAKPRLQGQSENKTIENLNSDQTYYFRIRAYDEWNNHGTLSPELPVSIVEPPPAVSDSFETLNNWVVDDCYQAQNGELINSCSDGWGHLAVFTASTYSSDADHIEASMRWSQSTFGTDASGIALLLDNESVDANGYLIYIRDRQINLYTIVSGIPNTKVDSYTMDARFNNPGPGDELSVQYVKETGRFEVTLNSQWIGYVSDSNISQPAGQQRYAGVMLHAGSNNRIDRFSLLVPPLPAYRMVKDFATDQQYVRVTDSLEIRTQIVDVNGKGVPDVPVDFTIESGRGVLTDYSSQFSGNIWVEAEDGIRQGPYSKGTDSQASGNEYIYVDDSPGNWGKGVSSQKIYVPKTGSYRVWLRVYAPDGNHNSCWFAVNGDTIPTSNDGWVFNHYGSWTWYEWTQNTFNLQKGFVDFAIKNREPGTKVDKILLTTNSSFTPIGTGGGPLALPNISNSEGWAYTTLTFDSLVSQVKVKAKAQVPVDSVLIFTEYAMADDPVAFQPASQTSYSGQAGQPLDSLFIVQLHDRYGNPCRNINVDFTIVNDGNATLSNEHTQTDSFGRASTRLTLGFDTETHVQASLPDFPGLGQVDFYGLADGALPTEIIKLTSDTLQAIVHSDYPESLKVQIVNSNNEPVLNFPVRFQVTAGNGKLNDNNDTLTIKTNSLGQAAVKYTVGDTAGVGKNIVRVQANRSSGAPLNGSPIIFSPNAQPADAYKIEIVSGNPQQQTAGRTLLEPLVVKIADQFGNGVAGKNIHFTITQGTGAFSQTSYQSPADTTVTTDASGQASVFYTPGNSIGQHSIQAQSVNSLPGSSVVTFAIDVTQPGPAKLLVQDGDNQSNIVAHLLTKPFKVLVKDPFGAPRAGIRIQFKSEAGGGKFGASDFYSSTSDANGIATSANLTLGTKAGTKNHIIKAIAVDYPDVPPATFYASAVPDVADSLVARSDLTFAHLANSGPYTLTVQVTDQYGNARDGQTVRFEVKQGGSISGATGNSRTVSSANGGISSVKYTMGKDASRQDTIEVFSYKTDGSPLRNSPITFIGTVQPTTPYALNKSNDNQTGVVLTQLDRPFIVTVIDTFDNPVPNVTALFSVIDGGGELIGDPEVLTNNNGQASIYLKLGQTAGENNNRVRASLRDYNVNPVEFTASATAGDPYSIEASGDTRLPDAFVGSVLQPAVIVRDSLGNGVSGFKVLFEIVQGGGTLGLQTQDTIWVPTKTQGIAMASWTLGDHPDTNRVKASAVWQSQPLHGSPITFTSYATASYPAALIRVSQDTVYGIFNQPLAESEWPTVRVLDDHGNPRPNHPVIFRAIQGGTLWDGNDQSSPKTVSTDQQGEARIGFKHNGTVAYAIVQAESNKSDQNPLTGSPVRFWIKGESSTARTMQVLSRPPAKDTVGKIITIRVKALNQSNQPVAHHAINFACLDSFSSIFPGESKTLSQSTDDNGVAEIQWHLGTESGKTNRLRISAINGSKDLDGSPDTLQVVTVPGRPDSLKSYVRAETDTAQVGQQVAITIFLRDQYNNPTPGYTPQLSSNDSGISFPQQPEPSDQNGQTQGKIHSIKSGYKHFRALLSGGGGKTKADSVYFLPGSASQIVTVAGPQQGNIGALVRDSLVVAVRDNYENPVPNTTVRFEAQNEGSFIFESRQKTWDAETDADGLVSAHVVLSQQAIPNFFKVSMQNPNSWVTFQINPVTNPTPAAITKVQGDGQHAQVRQAIRDSLVVQVLDVRQQPIWNAQVQFLAMNTGTVLGKNPASTDYRGQARVGYRMGSDQGLQEVIANLVNTVFTDTFHLFADPSDSAYRLKEIAGNAQTDTVGQVLPMPLTVQAVDEYGSGVPNIPVVFTLLEGDASAKLLGPDTVRTDNLGYANMNFQLGEKVGDYVVKAFSEKIKTDHEVRFNLMAVPDVPHHLVMVSGDGQYMTKGRWLIYPIVVRTEDCYGNPSGGVEVDFLPTSGRVSDDAITSDEFGLASTYWQIGDQVTNKLLAFSYDLSGLGTWQVSFKARGVDNHFPQFPALPDTIVALGDSTLIVEDITATDLDNDLLTYQVSGLPPGANYQQESHIIRWRPTPAQEGLYKINLRVDDNATQDPGFDVDSLVIHVKRSNQCPTVLHPEFPDSIDTIAFSYVVDTLLYVQAIDFDQDPLHFKWYVDEVFRTDNDSLHLSFQDSTKSAYMILCVVSDGICADSIVWKLMTKVELNSFSATTQPYKGVLLNWETSNETNNVGFNVLRSQSKGEPFRKINSSLVASRADGRYAFTDTSAEAGHRYYYQLEDVNTSGFKTRHDPVMIYVQAPKQFKLMQNYPNPFNPQTKIRFQLPHKERTKLVIYNTLGQVVRTLVDRQMEPGYHEIVWDGRNDAGLQVGSGLYYYRIVAGQFKDIKKMALLR